MADQNPSGLEARIIATSQVDVSVEEPSISKKSAIHRLARSREATTFLAMVVLFIGFSLTAKGFLAIDNLLDITRLFSLWAIVAVGQTMLLISKEIDLSVGAQYAFLVAVLGYLAGSNQWDIWLGSVATLVVGAAIGLLNGLLVTKIGIRSLIVTLGGYAAWRGLAIVLCGGYPIEMHIDSALFSTITGGRIFDLIPWMSIWMALIVLAGALVLAYTKFGYHIYATGSNLQAAKNTGIRTDRVKIACFTITGALCALIAIITVGWLNQANYQTGGAFELQVIAAALIGGTSITGGRGSILGSLLGAAILGLIVNGLVRVGLSNYWEGIAIGAIILVVTSVELVARRRGRR